VHWAWISERLKVIECSTRLSIINNVSSLCSGEPSLIQVSCLVFRNRWLRERETYNEQHQVIELLEDLASRLMDRADHCVSVVVSEVAQSHCEIQRCLGVES